MVAHWGFHGPKYVADYELTDYLVKELDAAAISALHTA
jgi:hypothetical protein